MNRPILTGTPAQEAQVAAAPAPSNPPPQQRTPAVPPADSLAGAFPAWDLLPASNFVRRVK